jgi:hypothetical protein
MVNGVDYETVCFYSRSVCGTAERETVPPKIGDSTAPHSAGSMSSHSTHCVVRLPIGRLISSYRHVRHLPTDLVTISTKRCGGDSQVEKAQRCNCLLMIPWSYEAMLCKYL